MCRMLSLGSSDFVACPLDIYGCAKRLRAAPRIYRCQQSESTVGGRALESLGDRRGISEAIMQDHDLVALWEAHTRTEFETRDVDGTVVTMVDQPYANSLVDEMLFSVCPTHRRLIGCCRASLRLGARWRKSPGCDCAVQR